MPRQLRPLSDFPEAHRLEIERLASGLHPPPRWLDGGVFQIESRAFYEWNRRRKRERKQVKRLRIAERDEWTCGLCGDHIEPSDLHIDHILPLSLGGASNEENLQASHSWCNIAKGNRVYGMD